MSLVTTSLPDDLAAAHAMILTERAARLEAEAAVSSARLEIERLKLLLAKARREQYGQSSERGAKLIEQLELQLAELEESAAEEETAAEIAAPKKRASPPGGGTRKPAPARASAARADRLSCSLCLPEVRRSGQEAG
jgi:transposase